MPNLGVSELVIVLAILMFIVGSIHLPRRHAWVADRRPGPAGTLRLRARSRWTIADWLLVASAVALGVLLILLARI